MTNTKNIVAIALLVLALGVFVLLSQVSNPALGSVMPGGEYMATTTRGMGDGAHNVSTSSVVTLGSVVIASSSASTFTIYNATSTVDSASTTLVVFPANATVGTYTFDVDLLRGLVVETGSSFDGDYVVSYRKQ